MIQFRQGSTITTLSLKALLKPLAKKPPKGAIMDANRPMAKACHCTGRIDNSFQGNCVRERDSKLILEKNNYAAESMR